MALLLQDIAKKHIRAEQAILIPRPPVWGNKSSDLDELLETAGAEALEVYEQDKGLDGPGL